MHRAAAGSSTSAPASRTQPLVVERIERALSEMQEAGHAKTMNTFQLTGNQPIEPAVTFVVRVAPSTPLKNLEEFAGFVQGVRYAIGIPPTSESGGNWLCFEPDALHVPMLHYDEIVGTDVRTLTVPSIRAGLALGVVDGKRTTPEMDLRTRTDVLIYPSEALMQTDSTLTSRYSGRFTEREVSLGLPGFDFGPIPKSGLNPLVALSRRDEEVAPETMPAQ